MVLRVTIKQFGVRLVGGRVSTGAVWLSGDQDKVRKQDPPALNDGDFLYVLIGWSRYA